MQRIPVAALHLLPKDFPAPVGSVTLQAPVFARPSFASLAIPKQLYVPTLAHSIRRFGSLNPFGRSNQSSKECSERLSSPWDEVEAQRPLAPDPYDGTYQMPRGAPDARNLSREQFHQFMKGKPQRFSNELKVTVVGFSLMGFGVGVTWLTARIMRPDDFEWVEEERRRIQEAKERIEQRIDQANKVHGR